MGPGRAALIVAAAAFVIFAGFVMTEGHIVDGCDVHIESRASGVVPYEVVFRGDTRTAEIAGGATVREDLCLLSPRDYPRVIVNVPEIGEAQSKLDPYCSDPRFIITDMEVTTEPRSCA